MGYVTVKEATERKLHFAREPTTRSWAILFGLISLGLGAAYYSYDYIWWKIAYVSGAVFVGLTSMEDWEECILDKDSKKVTIKRQNFAQKLFTSAEKTKLIIGDLDDIVSVQVHEDSVKYSGVGYLVVLHFGAGYQLSITETCSNDGDKSDQEYIAEKINNFLELDPTQNSETPITQIELPEKQEIPEAGAAEPSPVATNNTEHVAMATGGPASLMEERQSSTDESDDSFEQIDKTELVNFDETQGQYQFKNEECNEDEEVENNGENEECIEDEEDENNGEKNEESAQDDD